MKARPADPSFEVRPSRRRTVDGVAVPGVAAHAATFAGAVGTLRVVLDTAVDGFAIATPLPSESRQELQEVLSNSHLRLSITRTASRRWSLAEFGPGTAAGVRRSHGAAGLGPAPVLRGAERADHRELQAAPVFAGAALAGGIPRGESVQGF